MWGRWKIKWKKEREITEKMVIRRRDGKEVISYKVKSFTIFFSNCPLRYFVFHS